MRFKPGNLNVLWVEDNKHMQQIFWILMSSMGFRKVRFALNGDEALDLMITNKFDLILSDLYTSPVDGIEFTNRVRNSTGSIKSDIPIIIVSGNTEVRNVKAARDAGANEFMAKPVSAQGLHRRIQSVFNKPREFLEAGDFKGPDRRRRGFQIFDGQDRRAVT